VLEETCECSVCGLEIASSRRNHPAYGAFTGGDRRTLLCSTGCRETHLTGGGIRIARLGELIIGPWPGSGAG
jgi:hypothetical protein